MSKKTTGYKKEKGHGQNLVGRDDIKGVGLDLEMSLSKNISPFSLYRKFK